MLLNQNVCIKQKLVAKLKSEGVKRKSETHGGDLDGEVQQSDADNVVDLPRFAHHYILEYYHIIYYS